MTLVPPTKYGRDGDAPRLLLITGTPGCGKRSLGNLLANTQPFVHVDLDSPGADALLAGVDDNELSAALEELLGLAPSRTNRDVVATWSPKPDEALPRLHAMQSLGFELIWLDCDRGAALATALGSGGETIDARQVDPFEPDGRFRPLEAVLAEVLDSATGRRPSRLPLAPRVLDRAG